MLIFYASNAKGPLASAREAGDAGKLDASLISRASWIDAVDPTDEERSLVQRLIGIEVPSREDLLEIESSSRLSAHAGALMMSLPATVKDTTGYPRSSPVGFVVTRERVLTVRFDRLASFDHLARQICDAGDLPEGGINVFTTLIEQIVEQLADLLEWIGRDLDSMSHSIFATNANASVRRRPRDATEALTKLMQDVGRTGDLISKVSETLLCLSRMPAFLSAKATESLTSDVKGRLDTISSDTRSLREFQEHLANKTQFLLDALLGLTNIEQNNVFRVLTVVSVIGIPPTFFASMYGMNFKNMPEYDWAHGYAYGLTLIAVSAIAPAIWFKLRGWW